MEKFHSDDIVFDYARDLVNQIEVIDNNEWEAKNKTWRMTNEAIRVLRICQSKYRDLSKPKFWEYRLCIFQTLDRICRAEDVDEENLDESSFLYRSLQLDRRVKHMFRFADDRDLTVKPLYR
ncbi:hypothetical protein CHUAL_006229 [Chamberlinius hualienensis]